ncbi:LuxR family transcriptional regulator [Methylobacterium sp. NEAU K]|uniref:helix-turn-helix transcriptional regulator n=1 Tax=Methylobacterium sp. NEAU K TaxID=3064946 RepID=UPI002736463C|nr:LuxR family transcriptional regulator [Methylobacterium sp. NEAU K]MDP4003681.1 LuxR family transcriptional regulator [Methylobacterium sp. NEAU K]
MLYFVGEAADPGYQERRTGAVVSRKPLDHTLKLLKELDRAGSVPEVVATVQRQLAGFGIDAIIAGLLPTSLALNGFNRQFLVMESVPDEWRQRYLHRRYAAHDPIVAQTLQRQTGFAWSDPALPPPTSATAIQIMNEAADFDLRDGYTVPLTTVEGEIGGMSFAGSRLELAPEHRGMLTLVASYAFGHALLLRGQPIEKSAKLSPRERETLQWAAEGKTDWEIGEIMGISEHGVDSNLRCVRAKLRTRNRAQSVAEGFRLGLIV